MKNIFWIITIMMTLALMGNAEMKVNSNLLDKPITTIDTVKNHKDMVSGSLSFAFSPDSTKIVSSSWGESVKLWDVQSGQLIQTLKDHKSDVTSIAFSPDGSTIALGSMDKTVKLWDMQSGKILYTINNCHKVGISSIAFSPDGAIIASGGDITIKLWDIKNGKLLNTLMGHRDAISSIAFSPP